MCKNKQICSEISACFLLSLALCLECSKRFEILRETDHIRNEFIENIIHYDISDDSSNEIPIGNSETIRFTAKHLAEIQEILKQKPKKNK